MAEPETADLVHAWYLSSLEADAARERRQKAHAARQAEAARLAAVQQGRVRRKLCCMVPLFRANALRAFLLSVRDQPSAMTICQMQPTFTRNCVVHYNGSTCHEHWLQRAGLVGYGEAYRNATGVAWECRVRLPTIYALQLMAAHLHSVYARHGDLALRGMPPAWYVFGRSSDLAHVQDSARWLMIDRRHARAEACAFLGAVYALCRAYLLPELRDNVLDGLLFCEPDTPVLTPDDAVRAANAVRAAHADPPR